MFQLPEKLSNTPTQVETSKNDNDKGHLRDVLRFPPPPAFALEERLGGSRDEAAVRGRLLGGAGPSASSSLLSGKRNEAAARCRLLGGTSSSLLSTVAARFRPDPLAFEDEAAAAADNTGLESARARGGCTGTGASSW